MKIIHVLAETGYSGGEVQLEHLLLHLRARGHENLVVVPPRARFAEVCDEHGVDVRRVNMRRPWRGLATWQLRNMVASIEPDIVHFGCGRSTLWGGLALIGLNVPLRIATRRIDYPIARRVAGGWRYRHLVDHVIANCASVRRRVLDARLSDDRVSMIHEGIDVSRWHDVCGERLAARERLGIAPDALVVSCAATLRPRKGQRLLIEAFARLATRFPRAILLLAGQGSDLQALRERAQAVGFAERILLPGKVVPGGDVHAASDVSAMASYNEGLSNACLEASAAGLPLLVSAVGGLTELVEHGVTGYVVSPGDVDALTDRLAEMLADAGLRERMGQAGSARTCSMFTIDRMARTTEALLLRLLSERLSGPDSDFAPQPGGME